MNPMENLLFIVSETMPCPPSAIEIGYYFLGNNVFFDKNIGLSEPAQEVAARVIAFSKKSNQWVGVSRGSLVKMAKDDERLKARVDRHQERLKVWRRECKEHFWYCVFTLGFGALLTRKPRQPIDKEGQSSVPSSGIYFFGQAYITRGISSLIEQKMLKKVIKGEGNNAVEVFFPTPLLISRIMESQSTGT